MLLEPRELREDIVFQELLKICPGLEKRLTDSSEEEIELVTDLVYPLLSSLLADLICSIDTERNQRSSR
jgi:hypothetical protein